MSTHKMKQVWDDSAHVGTRLLLMLAFADQASKQGYCWTGHQALSDMVRLSKRQAMRLAAELVESGELYRHARPGRSNQWCVMLGTTLEDFQDVAKDNLKMNDQEAAEVWRMTWVKMDAFRLSRGDADDSPVPDTGATPDGRDTPDAGDTPLSGWSDVHVTPSSATGVTAGTQTHDTALSPDPLIPKENGIQGIQENWSSFLELVASQTSKDVFHASFQGSRPAAIDESVLVIETPGQRETDWINNRVGEIALSAFLAANPGTDIEKLWARPWRSK